MVNFVSTVSSALAATSLLSLAAAHPGEKHDHAHIKRQIDARQLRAAAAKRSLSACENSLKHRDLMVRSVQRRANALQSLREKRSISVSKFHSFQTCNLDNRYLIFIKTPRSSAVISPTSRLSKP